MIQWDISHLQKNVHNIGVIKFTKFLGHKWFCIHAQVWNTICPLAFKARKYNDLTFIRLISRTLGIIPTVANFKISNHRHPFGVSFALTCVRWINGFRVSKVSPSRI